MSEKLSVEESLKQDLNNLQNVKFSIDFLVTILANDKVSLPIGTLLKIQNNQFEAGKRLDKVLEKMYSEYEYQKNIRESMEEKND